MWIRLSGEAGIFPTDGFQEQVKHSFLSSFAGHTGPDLVIF